MLKACEQSPTLKRKKRTPDKNLNTFIRRNKVCSWPDYELVNSFLGAVLGPLGSVKEVCNRGVACSLLKPESLKKNHYSFSIALLFAFRRHFFVEKTMSCHFREQQNMSFFWQKKRPKNIMVPNWFFDHLQLFLV